MPGVRFVGNVRLGQDVTLDALREHYDAVLLCTGTEAGRDLDIPGEHVDGAAAATDFVGAYNGHPDHRHRTFRLDHPRAVVVGMGNVAMDVTRMLVCPEEHLAATDVSPRMAAALARSAVREVVLLGRRGIAQAAFSNDEMREIAALPGVAVTLSAEDAVPDAPSASWLATHPDRNVSSNLAWAAATAAAPPPPDARARVTLRLCTAPVEVLSENGRMTGIRVERTELRGSPETGVEAVPTGRFEVIEAGSLWKAVGYRGLPIPGVPMSRRGTIPHVGGRVTDASGAPIDGVYVAGWAKRGPSGLIGTNRACARETVNVLVADFEGRLPKGRDAAAVLGLRAVDWAAWQRLDAHERSQGEAAGRVRTKVEDPAEMLAIMAPGGPDKAAHHA
jgi:ferredoxin--NADP+ reductase